MTPFRSLSTLRRTILLRRRFIAMGALVLGARFAPPVDAKRGPAHGQSARTHHRRRREPTYHPSARERKRHGAASQSIRDDDGFQDPIGSDTDADGAF